MSQYVTVSEFKNAPTGIDCANIIPNGSQAQNDSELYNILTRASAWADKICNQKTLEATVNTEIREVTLNNRGLIRIFPGMIPIVNLQDVKYRVAPSVDWTDIPMNYIEILDRYFVLYNLNTTAVSPGITQMMPSFGYYSPMTIRNFQRVPITVKYTYTNGWTNTEIVGTTLAGASILDVKDATGAKEGQELTIYDSELTENVTVQSVNGNVITLTSPLQYQHYDATPISALPASVKQAVILLASFLIKERGSLSVAMGTTSLQGITRYRDASDIDVARELLRPFVRGVNS